MVRKVRLLMALLILSTIFSLILFLTNHSKIWLEPEALGDTRMEGGGNQQHIWWEAEGQKEAVRQPEKREELQQAMRAKEKKEMEQRVKEENENKRREEWLKAGSWGGEVEKGTRANINLKVMEKVMVERRVMMEQRCVEMVSAAERSHPPNSKEFLISEKYQLVWCNIFKAASSTWLNNYLKMAGVKAEEVSHYRNSPVEVARDHYPRPSAPDLLRYIEDLHYTSFLIVREPFQRLLSAYRDKIESSKQDFYSSLWCQILDTRYILPELDSLTNGKQTHEEPKPKYSKGKKICRPSFRRFVEFVLSEEENGNLHNEHWAPYYRFCSPCQLAFKYVLHFESLPRDEAFLLAKVPGLSDVLNSDQLHSSNTDYNSATARYFSQLPRPLLVSLYTMYRPDFEIFGYSVDRYFDLVT